jgi:cell division transport system ATP-binding protein
MIRLERATKKYGDSSRPALNEISLEISRGDFVFLVGSSGSGKSTLLRVLLREEKVDSGNVFVLGDNLTLLSRGAVPMYRRKLGVVFQDFRLLPNKSVFNNVSYALQVIGKSKAFIETSVREVLRMVGLEEKATSFPHALSGGEQQRVAIARALVNKPELLLADEPTGNLDPGSSQEIMNILEKINLAGTTIVMATHDRRIVDSMQRRVVEISHGLVVRDAHTARYLDVPFDSLPRLEGGSN